MLHNFLVNNLIVELKWVPPRCFVVYLAVNRFNYIRDPRRRCVVDAVLLGPFIVLLNQTFMVGGGCFLLDQSSGRALMSVHHNKGHLFFKV